MKIESIPVINIIISQHEENMIKQNNGSLPDGIIVRYSPAFPLNQTRFESIITGYKTGASIPPIDVKIDADGLYRIINGRHHVAASILLGRKTI